MANTQISFSRVDMIVFFLVIVSAHFSACDAPEKPKRPPQVEYSPPPAKPDTPLVLRDGDLIFHRSPSRQSAAIQEATHALYSHCGLIRIVDHKTYVWEAVGPVKITPLQEWINRGINQTYAISRLKNAGEILTPAVIARMDKALRRFKGKPYDPYFEWSDDRLYCSELIWKVYKEATGLELGELQHLYEMDLRGIAVKTMLQERYGKNIPLHQKLISPVMLANSPLLEQKKIY